MKRRLGDIVIGVWVFDFGSIRLDMWYKSRGWSWRCLVDEEVGLCLVSFRFHWVRVMAGFAKVLGGHVRGEGGQLLIGSAQSIAPITRCT